MSLFSVVLKETAILSIAGARLLNARWTLKWVLLMVLNCSFWVFSLHCFRTVCTASLYFCQFLWWLVKNRSKHLKISSSLCTCQKFSKAINLSHICLHELITQKSKAECWPPDRSINIGCIEPYQDINEVLTVPGNHLSNWIIFWY